VPVVLLLALALRAAVPAMMYGFGDVDKPLPETVALVEARCTAACLTMAHKCTHHAALSQLCARADVVPLRVCRTWCATT
jgi:hypothetical protein